MKPKVQISSPSQDEGDSERSPATAEQVLKKGPWTSAEDTILIEYVKKHGEGNWNAVQKNSGLSRCGKSCRLRWANHLRPNLKKGAFTEEEERKIAELHSQMGNKWARMASHLPGRTDNEIKNYWNTRIKRRQRSGLPLYPWNMSVQNSDENQQCSGEFFGGDRQYNILPALNQDFSIPMLDFFNDSQGLLSYTASFCDISPKNMFHPGFRPKALGFSNPTICGVKRFRDPDNLFLPLLQGGFTSGFQFDTFPAKPPDKIPRAYGGGYFLNANPGGEHLSPLGGVVPGSHALTNGNFSASTPHYGAVKLELPSLQYPETDYISLPSCTPPLCEAVDAGVLSPPVTESMESDCSSPRNSGLLESLFYGLQPFGTDKNQMSGKSSTSSAFTPNDVIQSSVSKTELDDCSENVSPTCSSTAIFSDFPLSKYIYGSGIEPSAGYLSAPQEAFNGQEGLLFADWVADDVSAGDLSPWNDTLSEILGGEM